MIGVWSNNQSTKENSKIAMPKFTRFFWCGAPLKSYLIIHIKFLLSFVIWFFTKNICMFSLLECNMKFSWREWVKVTMEFNQVKGRSEGGWWPPYKTAAKQVSHWFQSACTQREGLDPPLLLRTMSKETNDSWRDGIPGTSDYFYLKTSLFQTELVCVFLRHSWEENSKFM